MSDEFVYCDEPGCNDVVAIVRDGRVHIPVRHHGNKHVATFKTPPDLTEAAVSADNSPNRDGR